MELSANQIAQLTSLRRELHQFPEVSKQETKTARRIGKHLSNIGGSKIVTDLGGHGVAAIFDSGQPGPTVMIRAELDGLLINETGEPAHKSQISGSSHMCGHDGHMASLVGCAMLFASQPPTVGRIVLMFQPAEEDGSGAASVIADPRFASIKPDFAFSWHNLPGVPLGEVQLKSGPFCCASVGLQVTLTGRTAHASQPENGVSPAQALAKLIAEIDRFGLGGVRDDAFKLSTITYASLGEPTFGVAAGSAELRATLRAVQPAIMEELKTKAVAVAESLAQKHNLQCEIAWHDDFAASINDPHATEILNQACRETGLTVHEITEPMPFSEDFGRFGNQSKAAMLMLGSGDIPALHNPDYDFPDELISLGAKVMVAAARAALNT